MAGSRALLAGFVLAGVVLRCAGLGWGIPSIAAEATPLRSSYHFDEDDYLWTLARATSPYEVGDLHWGTLQLYLIRAALACSHAAGWLSRPWRDAFVYRDPVDFPRVYYAARAVSALAGIATLGVVFLLGRRLRDAESGLAAAAIVAVSPLHVVMSHFLTADVTMVLLLVAALHCFVASLDDSRAAPVVLAGALFGLAVAAKYNAAWLFPLWPARDLTRGPHGWKVKAAGYAAMAAGFIAGEPYGALHPARLARVIHEAHLAPQSTAAPYLLRPMELFIVQVKSLGWYGLGVTAAVLAAAGVLACVARPDRKLSAFARPDDGKRVGWSSRAPSKRLALLASILLLAASLPAARWPMARYTLPLVPVLAAVGALAVPPRWSERRRIAAYLAAVALPLIYSAAQVAILCGEHPADAARAWIERNAAAGSRIGQIWSDLPPLDRRRYDVRTLHPFPNDVEEASDLDRDLLVVDDLPLSSWSERFAARLSARYTLAAEFRREPRLGPWRIPEPAAPHDWKYTHPVVRIYTRR